MQVRVKRLSESAIIPQRGSRHAAGYDLFAAEAVTIPGTRLAETGAINIGQAAVPTGLALEIPPGYYGRVVERSGLAFKHHLHCGAGVVDADYRGQLMVLVYNFNATDFVIERGQRFAQIIFEQIGEFDLEESNELSETSRGSGGFGSTGIS